MQMRKLIKKKNIKKNNSSSLHGRRYIYNMYKIWHQQSF